MRSPTLLRVLSFRHRIALLSVLVSGVALAVFMSLSLAALQHLAEQRMDSDIREFAHKHLIAPEGRRHWEGMSDALRFFLGDEQEDAFILLVQDREGSVLYVSSNWPGELPVNSFPPAGTWGRYQNFARRSQARIETSPTPPTPYDSNNSGGGGRQGRRSSPALVEGARLPLKAPEFFTREAAGVRWRIGMMGNPDTTIVLGLNMRRLTEEMAQVRHALLVVLPVALLCVAVGAWWISQRALRPIEAVTKTIRQVKTKGLDQRVSDLNVDREFAELITHFNDLMDWLEKSFRQAVRFSADASHELKTPLTVLQAQVERAVHEAAHGSDEQRRYVAFGKELQRLKSITEKLLLLSRIDAGELKLTLRPLNLSELLEGVVEDTETLAPQLDVAGEITPDLWVMADADLLKQVVQNLASNAIKFNRREGFVRFDLRADDQQVKLITQNPGPGILPEDQDKLFSRFYRADKSRSHRVRGAGLGLSLAREIARAHHGDLRLVDSSTETTVFELTLPRTSA